MLSDVPALEVPAADLPALEPTVEDLYAIDTCSWQQTQDHLENLILEQARTARHRAEHLAPVHQLSIRPYDVPEGRAA